MIQKMTEYTEPILMETRSSHPRRRKYVGMLVLAWATLNTPLMLVALALEAILQDVRILRGYVMVFMQEALCLPTLAGLIVLRFLVGKNNEI